MAVIEEHQSEREARRLLPPRGGKVGMGVVWSAEACLRIIKTRDQGPALQSGAAAPRSYRRVADDDPIMNPANSQEGNPDRNISISFRQPPILKDGLPISYYRVGYSGITPNLPEYEVKSFSASAYQGQDVIEASIVDDDNRKLTISKKYDLEARTYVDDNTWSAPSVFTVIVKPENP